MSERTEITIKEAADKLKLSEKTIRRYAKDSKAKHRLEYRVVQGKFGDELRFYLDEVEALQKKLSNDSQPSEESTGQDQGKPVEGDDQEAALSVKALWTAYQDLQKEFYNTAGQLGFMEAQSKQVPLLTEQAESLREKNRTLTEEKTNLEAQFEDIQNHRNRLVKTLFRNQILYLILIAIVVVILVVISPVVGSLISSIFSQ